MHWYFAYGSNLSSRQMSERCPGAIARGPACLDDFRLAFTRPSKRWGGHAADILPMPGDHTWGVAWQVTDEHLASLDRFEGVANSAYRRITLRVAGPGGSPIDAIAYTVVAPADDGLPSAAYLDVILEGAREHDLPAAWLAHLESFRR